METWKKIISCLLLCSLLVTLFALPAAAEEPTGEETQVQEDPTEETTEETTGETTEETDPPTEETPEYNPYVYYFSPSSSMVPDYYSFYAKPFLGNSPHLIQATNFDGEKYVYVFNVVNVSALIEDEAEAPEGGYASFFTYCADIETDLNYGAIFRRLNLEDGYFCLDANGNQIKIPAEKVRSVLNHTFPFYRDTAAMEATVNAYLTETYGEEAILVQGLTGAEWASASQAAIWYYTNGADFSAPNPYIRTEDYEAWGPNFAMYYFPQMMYTDDPINILEKTNEFTATNIHGVYLYLLSLPGMPCKDIILTENSLNLVGVIRHDNQVTLLVDIRATIDSDDALTLTASYGGQTQTYELGKTNTLNARSGSIYAFTFDNQPSMTRTADRLLLEIDGTQTVHEVCFYESKPEGQLDPRRANQNLVGYANDPGPVMCSDDLEIPEANCALSITKVDAASGKTLSGVEFELFAKLDGKEVSMGTYTTDENGKIILSVDSDGEYYFKEVSPLPGYAVDTNKHTEGTVENSYLTGKLDISKEVVNASEAKAYESFPFTLTLDLSKAALMDNTMDWLDEEYVISMLESTLPMLWSVTGENQITGSFLLKGGQTISVAGIPLGTGFTVTEVLTEADKTAFTVTAAVTTGDGVAVNEVVTGTVAAENALRYTNTFLEKEEEPTETEPTETEPTVPKETKPSKPSDPSNPGTGDEEFAVVWMLLVMLCMSAVGVLITKRRVM